MLRQVRLAGLALGGVLALAALIGLTGGAQACDTPVYRYAMYRWQPAPYRVYYFHRAGPAKEEAEVNKLLEEAGSKRIPANLAYEAVDVSKPAELDRLPDEVKKSWEKRRDKPLPLHLVFAPPDRELWSGRLDTAAAKALLDSPMRKQIAQSLHDGNGAVLLLLPGKDAAENQKAEKVLQEAITRAAAAKPAAETPEPAAGPSAGEPAPTDPEKPASNGESGLRLGLLKLQREDAAEAWLVRSLSAIEEVPPERAKHPVLYVVFGRGRTLGPCPGDAITADSLDQLTAFLGGACSCVIKDQNPGADLLFSWDWEATAERLAADEEASKPSQPGYQEIPADPSQKPEPKAPPGTLKPPAASATSPPPSKGESPEIRESKPSATKIPPTSPTPADPPTTKASSPPVPSEPAAPSDPPASFAARQIWKFGVGLAVAAAMVMGAGFVLLRKWHP